MKEIDNTNNYNKPDNHRIYSGIKTRPSHTWSITATTSFSNHHQHPSSSPSSSSSSTTHPSIHPSNLPILLTHCLVASNAEDQHQNNTNRRGCSSYLVVLGLPSVFLVLPRLFSSFFKYSGTLYNPTFIFTFTRSFISSIAPPPSSSLLFSRYPLYIHGSAIQDVVSDTLIIKNSLEYPHFLFILPRRVK